MKFFYFALSLISLSVPAQNISSSLIACYALNGDGSEAVNNLAGTLSAVSATAGHLGVANTACYFNGQSSSYIKLPDSPVLKPDEISFSAWIKADTLAKMNILFARNTSTVAGFSAYYAATITFYNGAYRFGVLRQKDYTGYYPSSTTALSINTWYHVAFAMSSTTMQVYVNGAYESYLFTPTSFTYDPSKNVILGGTNESPSSSFKGSIDNVRFYNRVLSASEMSALYSVDPACGAFTTDLQERESEPEVRVYPNPTTGKLTLEALSGETNIYQVYDFSGSLIYNENLSPLNKTDIDLSNYPAGLYFFKMQYNGKSLTQKIVKE